jgi:hypothetical protein
MPQRSNVRRRTKKRRTRQLAEWRQKKEQKQSVAKSPETGKAKS